ncbi:hypothetical protein SADUNF_Sadunf12G0017900 [Salix dunnii]|uniref:Uncharacterized protein n=1 Tax=Salix dunnii TaxID=1413687 RepID=A0A835MVJ6_9ROSI|nr:hypothetical protein SADUNF_Sadunf12G0017900 [Salix dunnii]
MLIDRSFHLLKRLLSIDEAVRAKEIAEKKSMGTNSASAKKFALQAQSCIPSLRKRLAYSQKLNLAGKQQRVSTQTKVPSAKHRANGFHDHNITVTSYTWTWNKNMQLRPPSLENLINFGLSASDVSCIVTFVGCLKDPSSNVTKLSQKAGYHAANSNPFDIQSMAVKVQDLRGLKSAFQLTAQTSIASTSTTGHGESVVQRAHDQVKRSVMPQKETSNSSRMKSDCCG